MRLSSSSFRRISFSLFVPLLPGLLLPGFLLLRTTPALPAPARIKPLPVSPVTLARERVFSTLEELAGSPMEAPDPSLLKVANFEARLISRYRAATEDEELNPQQQQARVAALVLYDFHLALLGLESSDTALQRRGARIAGLSNLYVRLLPDNPRLKAAIYEGFLLPGLSAAPATGWGNASSLLEGAAMAFHEAGQSERQVEVLRQLLKTQTSASDAESAHSPDADLTRIHLADALSGDTFTDNGPRRAKRQNQVARLSEAIALLEQVGTPDLSGAKSRLPELRLGLEELQLASKAPAAQNTKPQTP